MDRMFDFFNKIKVARPFIRVGAKLAIIASIILFILYAAFLTGVVYNHNNEDTTEYVPSIIDDISKCVN